ncbi:MAG: amidohydrolase family protein [Candidatus Moduliflexus flocculans]|nr:amidohydrolase family protein [Candidatus Moduliflexus flocculans]
MTDLTLPILGPARSRWLYPIGERRRDRGRDRRRERLVRLLHEPARGHPGGPDPAGAPTPRPASPGSPRRGSTSRPCSGPTPSNGAWLGHDERTRGTLEPGKAADLVVLDRDLFAVPPSEIARVRVLLTLLDGREVFRDPSFAN